MKTCYLYRIAAVFSALLAFRLHGETISEFVLPQEVINLTTPKNLGAASKPGMTYQDMKHVVANSRYGFAFQIGTGIPDRCIVVANGNLVRIEKGGQQLGPLIVGGRGGASSTPIPFRWFEKYGDPLVIGLFPIGSDDRPRIKEGFLYAVKFSDLVDSNGNLRYFKVWARSNEIRPLSRLKVAWQKPDFRDLKGSPVVKMKDPIFLEGPTVTMQPFFVEEMKSWATIKGERDSAGKVVGLLVESVREDKPYGEAGLKAGMVIKRFAILKPEGPLEESAHTGWTKGDILLDVVEGDVERTITVSAERLRKAIPSTRNNTLAATTP